MRTGLTKRETTTDIWFDEKEPLIHIRTHNTASLFRLTAPYSVKRRRAASEAAKAAASNFMKSMICFFEKLYSII